MSIINITSTAKFNTSLSDIFLVITVILIFLDFKNFKQKFNCKYLWYFIGVFSVIILSHIFNKSIDNSLTILLSESIKFIIVAIYFYLGFNSISSSKEFTNLIYSWMIGLWITILVGIYIQINFLLGKNIEWHEILGDNSRFMGGFTDPNLAGTYLSISFFIVLIFIKLSKKKLLKSIGFITLIFTFICIILTQSRGTFIGFGIASLLYFILNIKKYYKSILILGIAGITMFLIIVDFDFTCLDSSFSQSVIDRTYSVINGQDQYIIRKNLTIASFQIGLDNPVLGVGKGNFRKVSKPYLDKLFNGEQSKEHLTALWSIPHNTFMGIFAEMGLIGIILFCSIFLILVKNLLRNRNELNIILLFALICVLIQSLSICLENFRGLWLFMGICLAVQKYNIKFDKLNIRESKTRKSLLFFVLIFLPIFLLLYFDVARKIPQQVNLSNNKISWYINNVVPRDKYTLIYQIVSTGKECKISIYEDRGKNEILVDEKKYKVVNGIGKIYFTPGSDVKRYRIQWESTCEKAERSCLINMYYRNENENKNISLLQYKYIPNTLRNLFIRKNWIYFKGDKKLDRKSNTPKLISKNIEVTNYNIKNRDGTEYIDLALKLKKPMKYTELLNIEVYTDNINNVFSVDKYFNNIYDIDNISNKFKFIYYINPPKENNVTGGTFECSIPFKGLDANYFVTLYIDDDYRYKLAIGNIHPNNNKQ